MNYSIQLFIFKTWTIIIPHENNFPLIRFDTKDAGLDFVRNLKSTPQHRLNEPYFVINNPQQLPDDVRKIHMFKKYVNNNDDDDSDYENDDDGWYMMEDGCFSIFDNLHLFENLVIDNNTNEPMGFSDFLEICKSVAHIDRLGGYSSVEYIQDLLDGKKRLAKI